MLNDVLEIKKFIDIDMFVTSVFRLRVT